MNIFEYSAGVQASFDASFPDYNTLSTYAGDFAIASVYGPDSIKETAAKAWKNWKSDYKWATEIIMVLNFMCWLHYEDKQVLLSKVYSDLFYLYKDKFYEEFDNNEEACEYFFNMTD